MNSFAYVCTTPVQNFVLSDSHKRLYFYISRRLFGNDCFAMETNEALVGL